jgi:hypothetical protein
MERQQRVNAEPPSCTRKHGKLVKISGDVNVQLVYFIRSAHRGGRGGGEDMQEVNMQHGDGCWGGRGRQADERSARVREKGQTVGVRVMACGIFGVSGRRRGGG